MSDNPTSNIQHPKLYYSIGEVAEINEERMTVKVNVIVFGRSTPTEVPIAHVEKV